MCSQGRSCRRARIDGIYSSGTPGFSAVFFASQLDSFGSDYHQLGCDELGCAIFVCFRDVSGRDVR